MMEHAFSLVILNLLNCWIVGDIQNNPCAAVRREMTDGKESVLRERIIKKRSLLLLFFQK